MKRLFRHWRGIERYVSTCLAAGIAWLAMPGCTTQPRPPFPCGRCIAIRELRYSDEDYVVPTNQTWRLSWSSPYKPFEITPAYDVRVGDGDAWVGDGRSLVVASPYRNGETGFLATSGPVVLWVSEGARFYLANEFIHVQARIYLQEPPAPNEP